MTQYEYVCTGPSREHVPPDSAIAAGVNRTRCIACRKAIKSTERRWERWGAYDRATYVKKLREIR